MKTLNRITSMLVVMLLLFGTIPAFAHSVVLPTGAVLSDTELEEIEGEGPAAALVAGAGGAIVGGFMGGVVYGFEYLYDKYVNKTEATFNAQGLGKAVNVGAAAGFVGGFGGALLLPTP